LSSRFEYYTTVRSETREGVTYEIKRDTVTGHLSCSCPAWRYQHLPTNERYCKHTRALMQISDEDRRQVTQRPVTERELREMVARALVEAIG